MGDKNGLYAYMGEHRDPILASTASTLYKNDVHGEFLLMLESSDLKSKELGLNWSQQTRLSKYIGSLKSFSVPSLTVFSIYEEWEPEDIYPNGLKVEMNRGHDNDHFFDFGPG